MRLVLERYLLRNVFRDGAGDGGGAPPPPPPGSPPGSPPPQAITAPWAATTDGPWKVGEKEWWETIPEPEAREHVKAKGYKNPAELALANYSLTKMQRGANDVVNIPGEGATQNDWDAFYTKMGRPATATDYNLTFGENVQVDNKMVEFGKTLFHSMGLNNKQAQAAANSWNEFVAKTNQDSIEAEQQQNAKDMAALETTWGPDLNANKAAGERVMKALGLDEPTMAKIENAIGSATIVDLLARIGRKTDEGSLVFTGGNSGDPNDPGNMTKEQANARITTLQADAEFMKKYTDKNNPGHQEAVDIMLKLFAKA